ncbi:hypothetical protein [Streptacidiphilus sp. PAMC 29251]
MSAYDGTHRITIPHPEKEYWVELKQHLTHGATEKSATALQAMTVVDGKPRPAPDVFRSRSETVLASIIGWNLDDANGTVWPINMQSLRGLPDSVFSLIHEAVEESNKPRPAAEQARFHGEGGVGDPDGDSGAPVDVDVPAGAGAVEAAGAEA